MSADFSRVDKVLAEAAIVHADRDGLTGLQRAVFLARGGHAPGDACPTAPRAFPAGTTPPDGDDRPDRAVRAALDVLGWEDDRDSTAPDVPAGALWDTAAEVVDAVRAVVAEQIARAIEAARPAEHGARQCSHCDYTQAAAIARQHGEETPDAH